MTIISNQDIPRNTIHQVHARLRSGKTLGARQATDVKNGVVLEICQNLQFKTFKIGGLSGLGWKNCKDLGGVLRTNLQDDFSNIGVSMSFL